MSNVSTHPTPVHRNVDLWLRRGSDTHPESTKTKCKAEKVADVAIQLSAGLVIWYVINRKEPKEGKTDTETLCLQRLGSEVTPPSLKSTDWWTDPSGLGTVHGLVGKRSFLRWFELMKISPATPRWEEIQN